MRFRETFHVDGVKGKVSLKTVSARAGAEHSGVTVSGVTYGGRAMTLAVSTETVSTAVYQIEEIWYILEANLPSNGANTVTVTTVANGGTMSEICAFCSEYAGVKQTAPEATSVAAQFSGNTITDTNSPSANSWVISPAPFMDSWQLPNLLTPFKILQGLYCLFRN